MFRDTIGIRSTFGLAAAATAIGLVFGQVPASADEAQAPQMIQLAAKETFERTKPHNNVGTIGNTAKPDATKRLSTGPRGSGGTPQGPDKLGAPGLADLTIVQILPAPNPVEGLPNQGYCYKWPKGGAANRLVFKTRNNGTAAAPASTVRVTFSGAGNVDVPTSALQPGQEWNQEIWIPNGCYPGGYHGSCNYTIRLDANNQVQESNEANNQDQSLCLLPAG